MEAPVITIFVRHSADCKYHGDEFCKRCNCKKHLRWTQNGNQYRRKTGCRSWAATEEKKRELEDQITGRVPVAPTDESRLIEEAVQVFKTDKKNQKVTDGVVEKYTRELDRLRFFAQGKGAKPRGKSYIRHPTRGRWSRLGSRIFSASALTQSGWSVCRVSRQSKRMKPPRCR